MTKPNGKKIPKICGNCEFWRNFNENDEGWCKALPPQLFIYHVSNPSPGTEFVTGWPKTVRTESACGEWDGDRDVSVGVALEQQEQ